LETLIAGFGPRGELPSPLPLPLPLSLPLPLPIRLPCAPLPPRGRAPPGGSTSCAASLRADGLPPPTLRLHVPAPCSRARPHAPAPLRAWRRRPRLWPSRPAAAARPHARRTPCPGGPAPVALAPAASPAPRWPSAPRPHVPARPASSAPRRVSRALAPRVLATMCPVGPVVFPGVASCAPGMRAACSRACNCSCVVRRSTFSFIPFSILV
jgi:hypothetical protein